MLLLVGNRNEPTDDKTTVEDTTTSHWNMIYLIDEEYARSTETRRTSDVEYISLTPGHFLVDDSRNISTFSDRQEQLFSIRKYDASPRSSVLSSRSSNDAQFFDSAA